MKRDARGGAPPESEASAFDKRFKYAIIACAVIEFFAIALALYFKAGR